MHPNRGSACNGRRHYRPERHPLETGTGRRAYFGSKHTTAALTRGWGAGGPAIHVVGRTTSKISATCVHYQKSLLGIEFHKANGGEFVIRRVARELKEANVGLAAWPAAVAERLRVFNLMDALSQAKTDLEGHRTGDESIIDTRQGIRGGRAVSAGTLDQDGHGRARLCLKRDLERHRATALAAAQRALGRAQAFRLRASRWALGSCGIAGSRPSIGPARHARNGWGSRMKVASGAFARPPGN